MEVGDKISMLEIGDSDAFHKITLLYYTWQFYKEGDVVKFFDYDRVIAARFWDDIWD